MKILLVEKIIVVFDEQKFKIQLIDAGIIDDLFSSYKE